MHSGIVNEYQPLLLRGMLILCLNNIGEMSFISILLNNYSAIRWEEIFMSIYMEMSMYRNNGEVRN